MTPGVTKPQVRAVVYVRLSEHKGEDDPSTSPERQREACMAYAKGQGWDVVEVVDSDLDVSGYIKGKRLARPGIRRIIELLPEVDKVVFLKVDRLARSIADFMYLADLAESHGAALVSAKEGFDLGTPFGRALAGVLAIFAELESATISDRVRDAKHYLAKIGRWAGGTVPYGYVCIENPEGKGFIITPEPVAARRIKIAAARLIAKPQRISMYGLAKEWSIEEGRPRSATSMRNILLNDYVTGRTPFEAILDPITVRELRKLYPADGSAKPRRKTGGRLLSGLLFCSGCEGRLVLSGGRAAQKQSYQCTKPSCPRKIGIRAGAAEQLIMAWFLAKYGDSRRGVEIDDTDTSADEAGTVRASILEVTDQMAIGGDLETLFEKLKQLRADLAVIEATPPPRRRRWVWRDLIRDEWERADLRDRQALLQTEVRRITVRPTGRGMTPTMARFVIVEADYDAERELARQQN